MLFSPRRCGPCYIRRVGVRSVDSDRQRLPENRRGVLLLIALVMLALFLLLGTTFIIIASRQKTCTASSGVIGSVSVAAAEETSDKVNGDILIGAPDAGPGEETPRGTVGKYVRARVSKYLTNSLLADKYGDWYEQGTVQSVGSTVNIGPETVTLPSPFYRVATQGQTSLQPALTIDEWKGSNVGKTPTLGSRVGRILSVNSTEEPNAVFRIVAETSTDFIGHLVNPAAEFNPGNISADATFTIQGREFTGDPSDPFMLHETYDAPDNRNLFLSWVQADAVLGRDHIPGTGDDPSDGWKYVVPSFHRADKLLTALKDSPSTFNNLITGSTAASALSLLRPMGKTSWSPDVNWTAMGLDGLPSAVSVALLEHPNFPGSNTRTVDGQTVFFDPINGPWDVDNDNDGVRDSVWIDVGMSPVQIDGVECQPLVAMMIVDLDSRVNLNAHGSLAESVYGTGLPVEVSGTAGSGCEYAGTNPSGSGTTPAGASLPAGSGWGVADINPRHLFGLQGLNLLRTTLKGTVSTGTQSTPKNVVLPNISAEGRYGDSVNGTGSLAPAPGRLGVADASVESPTATAPRDAHLPNSYASMNDENEITSIGSPIDPYGNTKIGLDRFGQPLVSRFSTRSDVYPWDGDRIDDPYDLSLGRSAPRTGWDFDPYASQSPSTIQDNLFSPSQLERLLRLFEGDTKDLSARLISLIGPSAEVARLTTTTESWDSTAVCVPLDRLEPLLQLTDQSDKSKPSLVSWDLQMGLRMDVNRPFGDGIDNTTSGTRGFGIADEPGEFSLEAAANVFGLNGTPFAQQALTNGRDVDNDSDVDADDQALARQLFTRHLYVLARTLVPSLEARAAAQWAANVVDFRDPDAVMTRFHFDPASPASKGWSPPNPNNPDAANVVWGCERPELLITEALAWRNVQEQEKTPPTTPKVYEYKDLATGGLVIELYHPWTGRITGNEPAGNGGGLALANPMPGEFTGGRHIRFLPGTGQVNLATLNGSGEPVFQIVVVDDAESLTKLTANPAWPSLSTDKAAMKRVLYPAKVSQNTLTAKNLNGDTTAFAAREDLSGSATTVSPGQFVIIAGPAQVQGDVYAHTISGGAGDTKGLEFDFANFMDFDKPPLQPLQMSAGLSEDAGDNVVTKRLRSYSERYPLEYDGGRGPVGALICVQNADPAKADEMLRMPAHNPGTFEPDLNFIENGRYRILLRRLANPLIDHNPITNPYICIDSLVFHDQGVVEEYVGNSSELGKLTLSSAERCNLKKSLADQLSANSELPNNIWRHTDANETPAAVNANEEATTKYRSQWKYSGLRTPSKTIKATLGFLPSLLRVPVVGDGFTPPFPWLTWLNREFASVHELLLVPKSSPATLLREHSHTWPFDHLFFQLGSGTAAQGVAEKNKAGILEFLRVPSRFADAEQRVSPADAASLSNALTAAGGKPLFLPPHNYLSHFREPGRVNLNTLSSEKVWSAMTDGRPPAPYEDEVRYSPSGSPIDFVRSEDYAGEPAQNLDNDPATKSQSFAGTANWRLDSGEDNVTGGSGNGNGALDFNHDSNNDGAQQVSGTVTLRSIASSRRGWPISPIASATGSTATIAGQFDRALNRKNVMSNQQWFSSPFQSGWPTLTVSGTYDENKSLLLRSWWESTRGIRLQKNGNDYGRTKTTSPISLEQNVTYRFTIRLKGNPSFALPGADKFPEIVGANNNLEPFSVTRSEADGVTTYVALLKPIQTRTDYSVQFALWSQPSVDILSTSLKAEGSDIELIANNDFAEGLNKWEQNAHVSLLGGNTAGGTDKPTLLFSSRLTLFTTGQGASPPTQQRANHSYADPDRNPYFRFREMIRLSNLATSRSNVFAVWMTIGFFKIEPHPTLGGTALSAEYGLDTGDTVRHKAFFIIDRSIPVGYRPGVPLNSDDATLLRRFINN
jgi:hypothetical protein